MRPLDQELRHRPFHQPQHDPTPRPVYDDVGPVGVVEAPPRARVADVIRDFVDQVSPYGLVDYTPMGAYLWHEVDRLILPEQYVIDVHSPVDLRNSRWELYQEPRHIPLMTAGRLQNTVIVPFHISMLDARRRIERRTPQGQYWQLSAITPDAWIMHRLFLPESVRNDLEELEELRFMRGGMRPARPETTMMELDFVYEERKEKKCVSNQLEIAEFVFELARENGVKEEDVLVMRGCYIPGWHEKVASFSPLVKVMINRYKDQDEKGVGKDLAKSIIWQRSTKTRESWKRTSRLPYPVGLPEVLGPLPIIREVDESYEYTPQEFEYDNPVHTCYLYPAHEQHKCYKVVMGAHATVKDILGIMESHLKYKKECMMIVRADVPLPTTAFAYECLPWSYVLCGDRMDAFDMCDTRGPRVTVSEEVHVRTEWLRGGVRGQSRPHEPRAVMITWAQDKVRREVPGLNPLTVTMLLKAEQRTISAVLHAKSPNQTREVIGAAYRRAGLLMQQDGPPTERPQQEDESLVGMRQAMLQQVTITGQIADRLQASPTNEDFLRLLESVHAQSAAHKIALQQIENIVTCLRAMHDQSPQQGQQQSQQTQEYSQDQPASQPLQEPPPAPQQALENVTQQDLDINGHPRLPPDAPTPGRGQQHEPRENVRATSSGRSDLPTPKRRPAALQPGGIRTDLLEALEEASRAASARQGRGPAVAPFRSAR